MYRKLIIFIITLAIALLYYKREITHKKQHDQSVADLKTALHNVTNKPKTLVFAVDLHNVLITPNIRKIISLILAQPAASFFVLFDLRFWYDIIFHGHVQEKLINEIDKKYKDKGITKAFLIETINTQFLNNEVLDIFNQLKKQGYKIYLASNIWPELYEDLLKKIPELQHLFDGYYIPSAENNYAEKPDPEYFSGLKNYVHAQESTPKKIIFIDDTFKNIRQAQKAGLIGFIFIDAKTLKQDFNLFGLLT